MQLPEDFTKRTKPLFGDKLWQTFTSALDSTPPTSIRLNTMKAGGMVPADGLKLGRVPWCESGYYLNDRPNFTFDPLLHAGLYYVQEASSMFISHVLRQFLPETPVKMLDLCAAPGGKSTAALNALPEGSLIVCNEPIRTRAQILTENIMKQGCPNTIVTNNYAQDIAQSWLRFDVILSDVPCSGEGMFRKDTTAVNEWSVRNVENCWRLQRDIVTDVWPSLRDGGLLVYSTCTFNALEDEENVRYIAENLGAEIMSVSVKDEWMITGSLCDGFNQPVYRFIPGRTLGEGLFVAVLRKHGQLAADEAPSKTKKAKNKKRSNSRDCPKADVSAWIDHADNYQQVVDDGRVAFVPNAWYADFETARVSLNIMSAGVTAGEIKGKDIIPAQSLALSLALKRGAFAEVELNYNEAVSYLRREQTVLPDGTPRGFVLVTYRNHPLGFMKNIGNRANNLYPAEWRIRSGHTPEGVNEVLT